ncbi:hypothetical protein KFU94_54515 [Chloroflexi bacterium TSY]|nr:hypothetical protein [Chloroflexi bacterium TSY]
MAFQRINSLGKFRDQVLCYCDTPSVRDGAEMTNNAHGDGIQVSQNGYWDWAAEGHSRHIDST